MQMSVFFSMYIVFSVTLDTFFSFRYTANTANNISCICSCFVFNEWEKTNSPRIV